MVGHINHGEAADVQPPFGGVGDPRPVFTPAVGGGAGLGNEAWVQCNDSFPGCNLVFQLLVEGKEIELLRKLVPVRLFTQGAEPAKLKEIQLTFDAQNMPKNANDKIFSALIEP
jgi:hypothetical protein